MKRKEQVGVRLIAWLAVSLAVSCGAGAQNTSSASSGAQSGANAHAAGSGWQQQFFWLEGMQFSSNRYGQIWMLNNAAGFHLTKRLSLAVGVPFYDISGTQGSSRGLGDAYAELQLLTGLPLGQLTTSFTVTAPTGNKSAGLSSGHPTVDFTNGLTHRWGELGLFGNAGIADTVANSNYFVRPISSYGWVGHFEAGGELFPNSHLGVGAAAYDILPFGSQTVYQRGHGNQTLLGSGGLLGGLLGGGSGSGSNSSGNSNSNSTATTGSASLDRDNGVAGWVDIAPVSHISIEVSYSHSVHFGLNTVAVSIGTNLWQLLRQR